MGRNRQCLDMCVCVYVCCVHVFVCVEGVPEWSLGSLEASLRSY